MHRSIAPEYEQYIVAEFKYWTLSLHENQHYFCRAYLWLARRGDMQRLSQISVSERAELWHIMEKYERALDRSDWPPDHMNYAWLGNNFVAHRGHGHMHLIPRYKKRIEFLGVPFTDTEWGRHYDMNVAWKFGDEGTLRHIQEHVAKMLGTRL